MIDLHTHILPGVDDGVKSEDEAVEFARVARADGVRTVVATPHCREGMFFNARPGVLEALERLRSRLAQDGVELELLPGAEVHLCPDLLARIRDGRAPTLGDNGKTLLLELSLSQYPVTLENLLFELRLHGIEVVFAHPERIRYFQDEPRRFADVVRLGAWGQITTGSVLGQFGSTAARYAEQLAREGLVHVLASDAHNTRGRPPVLSAALEALVPWVGERRARAMVEDAPRALLEGRAPDLPPPEAPVPRKTSFFARWLGAVALAAALAGCAGRAPETKTPTAVEVATQARVAESLFNAGRVTEALAEIDAALAREPDNAKLHHLRGTMLFRAGRAAEAERGFLRALELDPHYTDAQNFLGSVYSELGRPDEAERRYRLALADPAYPTPEMVYLNLGVLYVRQGRDADAVTPLRRAVEINPRFHRAHYELAGVLERRGELDEAAALYEVAAPSYRASAEYFYRLGLTYFRLGETSRAREALHRAVAVAPGSPSAAQAGELLELLEGR